MTNKILSFLMMFLTFVAPAAFALSPPAQTLSHDVGNTYVVTTGLFTPPGSAYDIVNIAGAAHKAVEILRIDFSMTQTTAGNVPVYLTKRSTANTNPGSGFANPTPVALDSGNPTSLATITSFTTVPTAYGTSLGNVDTIYMLVPAPATATTNMINRIVFDASLAGQPIILRGTENLSINLNGTLPSGGANATATIWYREVSAYQ